MINLRKNISCRPLLLGCMLPVLFSCSEDKSEKERPNILWITFEDTSAFELGLYGNNNVPTPNMERLAENGVVFEKVSSVAPQCSPARSTIISGSYSTKYGNDWHRCVHRVPEDIYFFPKLLKEAGYFCTNNSKTDYNTLPEQWRKNKDEVWNECNIRATYNSKNRKPDQPFFSVFNAMMSHQGRIATIETGMRKNRRVNPDSVFIPPYVPDLPEMRDDFAWHHESVMLIDEWLGLILDDLEEKGLADNTIIFFYSDHGGPMPQGKEFPYQVGYNPAFVISVPEKYKELSPFKPGTRTEQLVDFTDLAPTVLNLAGLEIPSNMDGKAFLGKHVAKGKKYQHSFRTNAHTHYDPSRIVFDGRYRYIRNYTPHHPHGIWMWYNSKMPSLRAWTRYWLDGKTKGIENRFFEEKATEMLFDLQTDPWEINNLAQLPDYHEKLLELREENNRHIREIKDLGFFPFFQRYKSDSISMYEWVRETNYDFEELYLAAEKASEGNPENISFLTNCLKSEKPEVRFWGVSGLAMLARHNNDMDCPEELKTALFDTAPSVASAAGEALCYLGKEKEAIPVMMKLVEEGQPDVFSGILTLLYMDLCKDELKRNIKSFDKVMEFVEGDEYSIYWVPRDIYYVAKFIKYLLGEGTWDEYYESREIEASLKTHEKFHEKVSTDFNFPVIDENLN